MNSTKITVFEIYQGICKETVNIWYDSSKRNLLGYADGIDEMNRMIEQHAMNDTYPTEEEWNRFLKSLEFYSGIDMDLLAVCNKARTLFEHPEYYDAKLNAEQRKAYFA